MIVQSFRRVLVQSIRFLVRNESFAYAVPLSRDLKCTKLLLVLRFAVWTGIALNQNIIVLKAHKMSTLGANVCLLETFG